MLLDALSPRSLGALIAFYEHRIFMQGLLWNVCSFDQWGVELGKVLAKNVISDWSESPSGVVHDSSTAALIEKLRY
jgi:glucose-6-phosphate isomerase